MRSVFVLLNLLSIAVSLTSCGIANKVTVSGLVKGNAGSSISDATIQISNPDQCCSGEEKPCTYKSDASGKWSIFFNTGNANQNAPTAKETCQYTVSKGGFSSVTGSFTFCIRGACAGEQLVPTQVTLSP